MTTDRQDINQVQWLLYRMVSSKHYHPLLEKVIFANRIVWKKALLPFLTGIFTAKAEICVSI